MYISEISPKEIRGALVTFSEIAINVGIVTGYFSTWVFSSLDSNISWRLMLMLWCFVPFNNALPLFILDGRNTTVFDDARKSPKSHDSFDEALSGRKDSGWRI